LLAVAMVGLSFVALTITSVSGIEAEYSGVAGGLINMTQSVGGRSDSPSQQSACPDAVNRCLWQRFPRRPPSPRPFLLVAITITDEKKETQHERP
jgi:hypothetical protein